MFFGVGSLINGHRSGWIVAGTQGLGLFLIITGLESGGLRGTNLFSGGIVAICGAIVIGYILPFFHTRPNPAVASAGNNIPFNLELVSDTDGSINGARVLYTRRF